MLTAHSLQIGYMLREYRVEQLLGEGGFGLTYLAFDTHLEKKVAIKEYMPKSHAVRKSDSHIEANSESAKQIYDWGLNAFINEAKTLAKFEAANLVSVYRFFKANGTAYIVMEYCEGGSLVDKVKEGVFSDESELIAMLKALIRSLQLVHNEGILHRDIKPENIVFRKNGEPVLIDFGAARQAIGIKNKNLTTIITPGYAPIEQYSEEGEVGPWSDVYSLAGVAYFCLTGVKPPDISQRLESDSYIQLADSQNPSALRKSIDWGLRLNVCDRPRNLSEWSRSWAIDPLELENASTETALNSDYIKPSKRAGARKLIVTSMLGLLGLFMYLIYINMSNKELQSEQSISLVADYSESNVSENHQKVLAVLPFFNSKQDKESDYLGIALANQVTSNLVYLEKYTLRSAGSSRKYANKIYDPVEVGKSLKVDFVIYGNYLKENNQVRLDIELMDVNASEMLWHEAIEAEYSNTFDLQDLVASKVAEKLSANFLDIENHQDIPQNPLAYEYYLRALAYPRSASGHQMAVEMLNNALKLEPNFAPIHVELGRRFSAISGYGLGQGDEELKSEKHFLAAMKINSNSIPALSGLSMLYTESGEAFKAANTALKILKIDPNNADAYFSLSYVFRYTGMLEESIKMADKAMSLSNDNYTATGMNYLHAGNVTKALKVFELEDEPFNVVMQAISYIVSNRQKEARAVLQKLAEMDAGNFFSLSVPLHLALINKDASKGLDLLPKMERLGINDSEPLYYWSSYYFVFGDHNNGFRLLREAINRGYYNVPFMNRDKNLDTVRGLPEFQEIMKLAESKQAEFKQAISASYSAIKE